MRPFVCLAVSILSFAHAAHAADWKHLVQAGKGTMVTELEVGGGDEYDEGAPVFIRPVAVCVAKDHSFYVVDNDGFIVHFDLDGTELGRLCRKGEGPGELMGPSRAVIDASGRLVVSEIDNRRLSILQTDGKFVASLPYQDMVEEMAVTPDGSIVMVATGDVWYPEPHSTSRLIRWDAGLRNPVVIDSLQVKKFRALAISKESSTVVSTPYYLQLHFCVLADGSIAYGSDDRYQIRVVGPDLKPSTTLRRDIEPHDLTNEEREDYFESFDQNGADFISRLRATTEFPRKMPLDFRLFADGSYLIVARDDVLDVFEDGAFLGEVKVPGFRAPRAVDGDRYFRPHYSREKLPAVAVYSVR